MLAASLKVCWIMQQSKFLTGILWLLLVVPALRADASPDRISVNGSVDKPGDWTVARLKLELAGDVTKIEYSAHDGKHTSSVVPLASLLKAAGVQTGLKQPPKGVTGKDKHVETHYTVVVQGRDGYYAVFSIGELMTDLDNRKIWLALDEDGKALPDADGPMKLIVPDDGKPARWVHGVQSVSVVKVEPPATRPVH
jgi:DMSO/TMAO reductase YedYZ molybdopterin-dependent catalytic subunit